MIDITQLKPIAALKPLIESNKKLNATLSNRTIITGIMITITLSITIYNAYQSHQLRKLNNGEN